MEVFDEYGPQLTPEQLDLLRRWHADSTRRVELQVAALELRLLWTLERMLVRPRALTDFRVDPRQAQACRQWRSQWPTRS